MKRFLKEKWYYFLFGILVILVFGLIVIYKINANPQTNDKPNEIVEQEETKIGTLYKFSPEEFDYNLLSFRGYIYENYQDATKTVGTGTTIALKDDRTCMYIETLRSDYVNYTSFSGSEDCSYSTQGNTVTLYTHNHTLGTEKDGLGNSNLLDWYEDITVSGTTLENGKYLQSGDLTLALDTYELINTNAIQEFLYNPKDGNIYKLNGKQIVDESDYIPYDLEIPSIDPSQYEIVTKPMDEVREEINSQAQEDSDDDIQEDTIEENLPKEEYIKEINFDEFTQLFYDKDYSILYITIPNNCLYCTYFEEELTKVVNNYGVYAYHLNYGDLTRTEEEELRSMFESSSNYVFYGFPVFLKIGNGKVYSMSDGYIQEKQIINLLYEYGFLK